MYLARAIVAGAGITETYTYKSSNVLIKTNRQWRAVASHVSGVQRNDDPADQGELRNPDD